MHANNTWHSAQGLASLVEAIRTAPVEPGMTIPDILLVAPPVIQKAKGTIAHKFEGAERRATGLNEAIRAIAKETACEFFDAGSVTDTCHVDGVHLDEDQHRKLGEALARAVQVLLLANASESHV